MDKDKKTGKRRKRWTVPEAEREILLSAISLAEDAAAMLKDDDNPDFSYNLDRARSFLLNSAENIKYIVRKNKYRDFVDCPSGLRKFVENRVEFVPNHRELIITAYEAYKVFLGLSPNDMAKFAFTRIQFTKKLIQEYGARVRVDVQRVNGSPPARCLIGLRIKDLAAEAKNDG
jgi:hypothetical protein